MLPEDRAWDRDLHVCDSVANVLQKKQNLWGSEGSWVGKETNLSEDVVSGQTLGLVQGVQDDENQGGCMHSRVVSTSRQEV